MKVSSKIGPCQQGVKWVITIMSEARPNRPDFGEEQS